MSRSVLLSTAASQATCLSSAASRNTARLWKKVPTAGIRSNSPGEWLDHALEDARLKSLFLRRPSGFCHRLPDESRELEGLFHMMAEEDRNQPKVRASAG